MKMWPKHPVIYEINTWVWLRELSQKYQRPVNLATLPEEEWETIASFGFDAGSWAFGSGVPRGVKSCHRFLGTIATPLTCFGRPRRRAQTRLACARRTHRPTQPGVRASAKSGHLGGRIESAPVAPGRRALRTRARSVFENATAGDFVGWNPGWNPGT